MISKRLVIASVLLLLTAMVPVLSTEAGDAPVAGSILYVGAGSTYSSIQDAVDAAAPGDTVVVRNGSYNENVTIWKTLTVRGNSTTNCRVNHTYWGTSAMTDWAAAFNLTADWINLTGFNITARGDHCYGVQVGGGLVLNCLVAGCNITTYDDWGIGLRLNGGAWHWVIGNNITTFGDDANGTHFNANALSFSNDNRIRTYGFDSHGMYANGGSFHNVSSSIINTTGWQSRGIYFENGHSHEIYDNDVVTDDYMSLGIYILSSTKDSHVVFNRVHTKWTTSPGIYMHFCSRSNVSYNTVRTDLTSSEGVYMYQSNDCRVIDNTIRVYDSAKGIDSNTCDRIEIIGNYINTTDDLCDGVWLESSDDALIFDNDIDIRYGYCDGIRTMFSDRMMIKYNRIRAWGYLGGGIRVSSCNIGDIGNNRILTHGTVARGVHIESSSDQMDIHHNNITTRDDNSLAVYLDSVDDNNVTFNNITTRGDFSYGVRLYLGSDDNNITGNNITTWADSTHLVYISHSSTRNLVKGNELTSRGTASRIILTENGANRTTILENDMKGYSINGVSVCIIVGDNTTISDNWIMTSPYGNQGINVDAGRDLVIHNNTITTQGDYAHGILVGGSHTATVDNCTISTSGSNAYGIQVYGNQILTTVEYNDITTYDVSSEAIYLNTVSHSKINKNIVQTYGQSSHGINQAQYVTDCRFTNNDVDVRGNDAIGIRLNTQSSRNNFYNSTVSTLGTSSFAVRLFDDSSSNTFIGLDITTAGSNGFGVYSIDDSERNVFIDVNISTSGPNAYGYVLSGTDIIVVDSIVSSSASYDINVQDYGFVMLLNTTFWDIRNIDANGGVVHIMNYLDIRTFMDDGVTPLQGAEVQVLDSGNVEYATPGYGGIDNVTAVQGVTDTLTIMDRYYYHSNTPTENVTTVKVKFTGDATWEEVRDVNMSTSHREVFITGDIFAPIVPGDLKIERMGLDLSLNISWEKLSDIVNYTLYTNQTGTWEIMYNDTTNWTHDVDLADETWHWYRIQTIDLAGHKSALSPMVGHYLRDIIPPMVPENLTAVVAGGGVNVSWSANYDDTINYILEMHLQDGITWYNYYNDTGTWNFIQESWFVHDTALKFRICAMDDVHLLSAWSPVLNFTFLDLVAPQEPTNLTAVTKSEYSVALTWDAPLDPDIVRYQVYVNDTGSSGGDGPYYLQDECNGTSYDVDGLSPDTTYHFVVVALDEALNPSPWSIWARNTTMHVRVVPMITDLIPANGTTDVEIGTNISAMFNVEMEDSIIGITIFPTVDVELEWSSATVLNMDPLVDLDYNTTYKVTFPATLSSTEGKLMDEAVVLEFTTELAPVVVPKTITIITPLEATVFLVGSNITVTGMSTGFDEGTQVTVSMGSATGFANIGSDGGWTATFEVPAFANNYTVTAVAGAESASVVVEVRATGGGTDGGGGTTDGNTTDGRDGGSTDMTGLFVIVGIVALVLVIAAIVVVLFIVLRRKKEPTEETGAEEEEELPPELPPMEESSDAIVADIEESDIFTEKAVEKGRQEIAPAKPMEFIAMEEEAPELEAWGGPNEDPVGKPDGDDKPPMLALPPAQVYEADFSNSSLPEIDEIFIVSKSGIMMAHYSWNETSAVDEDILASMIQVLQQFVKDSFNKDSANLKNLGFGDLNMLLLPGKYINVIVFSPEQDLRGLEKPIGSMINDIEFIHKDMLSSWDGDTAKVNVLADFVQRLVQEEY